MRRVRTARRYVLEVSLDPGRRSFSAGESTTSGAEQPLQGRAFGRGSQNRCRIQLCALIQFQLGLLVGGLHSAGHRRTAESAFASAHQHALKETGASAFRDQPSNSAGRTQRHGQAGTGGVKEGFQSH